MTTVDDRCRPLFFRHVFDDFDFIEFSEKDCWARGFGKARGPFWEVLGVRGRVLGGSWGSWEAPGGVLGGSWAVLGRSWSNLLSRFIWNRFFDRFGPRKGCQKGGIWGAKMEPKSVPKRPKIEIDFQERKNTLQDRLGSVLRPS